MKLTESKKGALSGIVTGLVTTIIGIVLIFLIVGGTSGTLTDSADNISGSGLPLASLFSSSGVVLLVFMAGILIAVVGLSLKGRKGN